MLSLSRTPVKVFMNSLVVTLGPEASLAQAAQKMKDNRIGAVVIINQDKCPIGIITDRDFVRFYEEGLDPQGNHNVSQVMTSPLITVSPTVSFSSVFDLFNKHNIRQIPVVNKQKLVGIVSYRNLLMYSRNTLIDALEENRSLQKEANTDELTGLYNKRYFLKRIADEHDRMKRYGVRCSLVFMDLDHFKQINDAYSHPAGDYVLHTVSEIFKKNARNSDILARFGGEEFVIITPNTNAVEAAYLANKLRTAVQNHIFRYKKEKFNITISAGVSSFSPTRTVRQTMERADSALYEAKHRGRNRVCRWRDSINSIIDMPFQ